MQFLRSVSIKNRGQTVFKETRLVGWRVIKAMSFHPYLVFQSGCSWAPPGGAGLALPCSLGTKAAWKGPEDGVFPCGGRQEPAIYWDLSFASRSPRLRAEWKSLAAPAGRADHQQPFKRLRRCLRLPSLVLWLVLALWTGHNPASVKLPVPWLPCFFACGWCGFWKWSAIFRSWCLARCQQVGGKALGCFCCVSSREGTRLSSARSTRGTSCSSEGLVRCSYKILLASHPAFSLREHAFIRSLAHSRVCQQVFVSASDPPEDHTSYGQALGGLWPPPLLNVVGVTFQQGTCLCRGLPGKIWRG